MLLRPGASGSGLSSDVHFPFVMDSHVKQDTIYNPSSGVPNFAQPHEPLFMLRPPATVAAAAEASSMGARRSRSHWVLLIPSSAQRADSGAEPALVKCDHLTLGAACALRERQTWVTVAGHGSTQCQAADRRHKHRAGCPQSISTFTGRPRRHNPCSRTHTLGAPWHTFLAAGSA